MESSWLERNSALRSNRNEASSDDYIPTWKLPISKSFSSALSTTEKFPSDSSSGIGSGGERDMSTSSNSDPESCPIEALKNKISLNREMEEEGQVIQILLPCIVCNRTFAPEALERHSKVCTKVNIKTPYKPERGKFESAEQRKKGTKVEYFIPPPQDGISADNRPSSGFSRGSKNRSSLRGTSCTTRSTLNSESLSLLQSQMGATSPLRRQRSMSVTRGERGRSKTPAPDFLQDDHSEFGSNSEESQTDSHLPSYAKPLAPTDECPYCNRCFGPKAYDRHVEYCREKCTQRQYEIQPVPKEKIEALERQEIRTKYRPIKGSSSCTSLRSVSPGKDFASMARLFGLRRTDGTANLYNNQLANFKKSNESLTNSCYGDFTRGMRRMSPSPSRAVGMANKINNLFSKTFHLQPSNNNNNTNSNNHNNAMRINTSSNIPKFARSNESLTSSSSMPMHGGNPYSHVASSGYGQPDNASFFNRNSRSRSSLHKNFFRTKRSEPEGTENTGTTNTGSGFSSSSSPLIITPMTFYTKTNKPNQRPQELYRPKGSTLLTQDPTYDPYEMAAKQLEELLKTQPMPKNTNKKTARKLGLERAFESVGVHTDSFTNLSRNNLQNESDVNKDTARKEDRFVFDLSTEKMDDSYWDEILSKSAANTKEKQDENRMSMSTSSDAKSQQQSDGGLTDANKSRALSQISSADSGFSRSDVHDREFETLETIVANNEAEKEHQDSSKRKNSLTSLHPSISRSSFLRRTESQCEDLTNQQFDNPSPSLSPYAMSRTDLSQSNSGHTSGARFCHECGNSYPSPVAKFCPECGEKRVFKM